MEADELLCAKVQLEELKAQWQRLQDGRIAFSMLLDDSSQSVVSDDDSEEIALSMQIASLEVCSGLLRVLTASSRSVQVLHPSQHLF